MKISKKPVSFENSIDKSTKVAKASKPTMRDVVHVADEGLSSSAAKVGRTQADATAPPRGGWRMRAADECVTGSNCSAVELGK
jgi:hypothetical protein